MVVVDLSVLASNVEQEEESVVGLGGGQEGGGQRERGEIFKLDEIDIVAGDSLVESGEDIVNQDDL